MSTKTTNFEFIKPEKTDPADITATNENWDKLDEALIKRDEDLSMSDHRITDLADPINGSDAATRDFVERHSIAGNTYVAVDYNNDGNITLKPYVADEDELVFRGHINDKNNPHKVTAEQVGAAPAGCGYGDKIPNHLPWDTSFEEMVIDLTSKMEKGTSKQFVSLDQIYESSTYGEALLCKLWYQTTDNIFIEATELTLGCKLRKTLFKGVWSPWEFENPPMEVGKEYRTTERYNNKPVYVKLVDCGNLPNASKKEISTGINGSNAFDMNFEIHQEQGQLVDDIYVSTGFNPITRTLLLAGGNLQIYTNADVSTYTAKVTIKYTK